VDIGAGFAALGDIAGSELVGPREFDVARADRPASTDLDWLKAGSNPGVRGR
jgi:hypothetical protein